MISRARKSAYLLLMVLAVTSWWLLQLSGIDEERTPVPRHSPDFFSESYVKWEMDARGGLKSKLVTDKMTHYPDDGATQLLRPQIIFANGRQTSWLVNSDEGILTDDGKKLLLKGRVVIDRGRSGRSKALKITTTDLHVEPESSYAQTSARAEILSPPNVTTGTGMKLFFAEPIKLQLLADVKGKYEKK